MSPTFSKIVVGTDGQRGRAAATLAHTIAGTTGAQVLLVGVGWDLPLPLIETSAQVRLTLETELRTVRDELAPDARTQVAVDPSPAHALRKIAKAEHADLVVVGSLHRGRLQRLTCADRTMQVLHGAPCAVAVAPDHVAACQRLEHIGVGVDETPESAIALAMALDLAASSGGSLRLLTVASDVYGGSANLVAGASYADSYREIIDSRLQIARETMDAAHERCQRAGVHADTDVRLGDETHELTNLSRSCDLLALGSRRWGPIRRLALGSTAERVLRDAACPVLVPPRHAATEYPDLRRPAGGRAVS